MLELDTMLSSFPFEDDKLAKVAINDKQSDVAVDHSNFDLEQIVETNIVGTPTDVSINGGADTMPLRTNTAALAETGRARAMSEPLVITDDTGTQLLETESARVASPSNQNASNSWFSFAPNSTSRWTGLPGSHLFLMASTQLQRSHPATAIIFVSTLLIMVLVATIAVCVIINTSHVHHSPQQHSPKQYSPRRLQSIQASIGTNSSRPVSQENTSSPHSPSLRELPRKAQSSSAKTVSLTGAGKLAQVIAKMPCLDVRCKVPPDHICLLSVPSLKNVGFDQMLNITNMTGTTLLHTNLTTDSHGSNTVQIYDLDKQPLACCSVDPSKAQDRKASFLILDKQGKPYATVTREHAGTQAQGIFRVRPQQAANSKFDPGWGLALHMNESPGHSHLYLRGQFVAQFVALQSGGYEGHFASGGDCALLLLCFLLGEIIVHEGDRSRSGNSASSAV
jgi:hypothetical protein